MINCLRALGRGRSESASAGLCWRPVRQAAVGALLVVVSSIAFDNDPRLPSIETPFHIQPFGAELPNETVDGPVLPGFPRLDIHGAAPPGGEPRFDRLGDEFWPIITAQVAGHARCVDETLKDGDHLPGVEPGTDLDRETHPGILIHDRQTFEGRPIRTAIVHEGIGPNVMRLRGLRRPS
jgi:hypothetical protein